MASWGHRALLGVGEGRWCVSWNVALGLLGRHGGHWEWRAAGVEQRWVSWVPPVLQVEISGRGLPGRSGKVNRLRVFQIMKASCKIKWFRLNSLSTRNQLTFGIEELT